MVRGWDAQHPGKPQHRSGENPGSKSAVAADLTFIFREWICMILARASSLGIGNSIFRSRRPDRSRAGSRMSTLLVAAIT